MQQRSRRLRRKLGWVLVFSVGLVVLRTTPLRARMDCGLTMLEAALILLLVCHGGSLLYDTLFEWRLHWPPSWRTK
ncbi:MAG: hypothetical protein COZ06_25480 [Armatimonadetes bacterium CG_4_10_14_3_um_filter_66_18]|nr:hypothetical protein [Armatimonadota bacterium]PIX42384.1 MAG: hypothetical protein COZ57_21335 [Armatimonadetes bacterium CG_4_8_14_3_um_filter_66_20]PIY42319.1 MAG: hypothetical protein COZ06_25480 [Armatimonadetes bacterium CG_4_10_14_3_um_filter_66_18]PIZ48508.1 MAG: hypothetical protein COY42_06280 [Armatimonadetes bacterium CG_4_10_14_0_8_um_filter_66_14]PJB74352.1 MAG: hypothetical protein CO096_03790 [Armatimonadetes bacterium CG_4_9_14_3_um_filter_66_14]